jgi:hypothetical protein
VAGAKLGQLLGRLVVAGDQDRGLAGGPEDLDAHAEVAADVAEVAGPDQDVGRPGAADEPPGGGRIGM